MGAPALPTNIPDDRLRLARMRIVPPTPGGVEPEVEVYFPDPEPRERAATQVDDEPGNS